MQMLFPSTKETPTCHLAFYKERNGEIARDYLAHVREKILQVLTLEND